MFLFFPFSTEGYYDTVLKSKQSTEKNRCYLHNPKILVAASHFLDNETVSLVSAYLAYVSTATEKAGTASSLSPLLLSSALFFLKANLPLHWTEKPISLTEKQAVKLLSHLDWPREQQVLPLAHIKRLSLEVPTGHRDTAWEPLWPSFTCWCQQRMVVNIRTAFPLFPDYKMQPFNQNPNQNKRLSFQSS